MIKIFVINILSFCFFVNLYSSDDSGLKKEDFASGVVYTEVENHNEEPVSIILNHNQLFKHLNKGSRPIYRKDDRNILSLNSKKKVIIGIHINGGVLFKIKRSRLDSDYKIFSSEELKISHGLRVFGLTLRNKTNTKDESSSKE